HHVIVRNPLPANAEFVRATPAPAQAAPELIWRLGTLPPCGCREIVLVLRPTGAGDVRNCARVQFEHGERVTTRVLPPPPSVAPAPMPPPPPPDRPAPAPSPLVVRKTAPERVLLYDAVPFVVEITNTGSVPLTDVELTDILPAGLEFLGEKPT